MRVILMFSLFLWAKMLLSQPLDYHTTDSICKTLRQNADYKTLQTFGETALNAGIDFFDLRMSIGEAAYRRQRYEKALRHFQAAHEMFPTDTLAQEYLYFSLLFTGRRPAAEALATGFSAAMQQKINFQPFQLKDVARSFKTLSVSGGVLQNNNFEEAYDTLMTGSEVFAREGMFGGQVIFGNVFLENQLSTRLQLYNNFSYVRVQAQGLFQNTFEEERRTYDNDNYQYNIGASYALGNNTTFGASFGYYQERANYLTATFDATTAEMLYNDNLYEHQAFSASLSGGYRYRRVAVFLTAAAATFADTLQQQGSLSVVCYPFGNLNFYTVSEATRLNNGGASGWIFSQTVGGKLANFLTYTCGATYGNQQNYINPTGFIAYNTAEPILFSTNAALRFSYKKFTFEPAYTLQQREKSYIEYSFANGITTNSTITNKFFNHLFTTTIQWNF